MLTCLSVLDSFSKYYENGTSTIISCFVFQLAREDKFFEATIGESRVRLYVQDALALGVIQNEIRADYGEIYL